jgi:hypothetical protein
MQICRKARYDRGASERILNSVGQLDPGRLHSQLYRSKYLEDEHRTSDTLSD